MEDLKMMKQDIKKGTLLVVDDPSLTADGTRKIKGTNLSEIDKCHLEFLCAFVARVEKRFPPEQRRDLNQFEIGRLEGALSVLLWVFAPEKYPLLPFGRIEDEEPGP
jgi:hypothetical protein